MSEPNRELEEIHAQINTVLDAAEAHDLDGVYDNRAAIVSMYAQAMVEFHFDEEQLDWLNELLSAVESDDIAGCRKLLAQEQDTETLFLATQFTALIAGFFHHDELLTVIQAIGLQALLREMEDNEE